MHFEKKSLAKEKWSIFRNTAHHKSLPERVKLEKSFSNADACRNSQKSAVVGCGESTVKEEEQGLCKQLDEGLRLEQGVPVS